MPAPGSGEQGTAQDARAAPMPEHLVPLPGGPWALWRRVILRGAGFPAREVLRLAALPADAACDRLLDVEEEAEALRQQAFQAVNDSLDELRCAGAWEDKARRRPLLKAVRALSRGKVPNPVPDPVSQAAIDALTAVRRTLEAARGEYEQLFHAEVERLSRDLARVASWSRFREAVAWQNRHAVVTALDHLAKEPRQDASRNAQRRQHEELVASYLQRYCAKNDSIGFFGPVGWAFFTADGPPVRVRQGPEFLESREVYFENWCIDALARRLTQRPGMKEWIAPRLRSTFRLEDHLLHPTFGPPLRLRPQEARLVAACDGRRSARALAAELAADDSVAFADDEEVLSLLAALSRRGVFTWTLEVPLELYPERTLRQLLDEVEPPALRNPALESLGELEAARDRVARAAGDDAELVAALENLEETFSRLTSLSPRRHLGETYAARGLVYEDCRREVKVELGRRILDRLGPPLTLVLDSARWLTAELTQQTREELRTFYADLKRPGDGDTKRLDSYRVVGQFLSRFFLKRGTDPVFIRTRDDFHARWLEVLGLDRSMGEGVRRVHRSADELAARLARHFPQGGRSWSLARYLSPDVMIAASGEEAFRRGEFHLVLGEIHVGNTLAWSCFVSQHPEPGECLRAMEWDLDSEPVVLPQLLKQSTTQRMNIALELPTFYHYHFADAPPLATCCRVLRAGDMVVEETASGLLARTRDGEVEFDAVELFGFYLNSVATEILGSLLPPARHWPRITVDDVVLCRERWHFAATDLDFADPKQAWERYSTGRRWARQHGLPRFCFFKVSTERKPCFLDLASPIYVDLFAKLVRRAAEEEAEAATVTVTEMLPRLDQIWLADAEENLYTSELRIAAVESRPAPLTP